MRADDSRFLCAVLLASLISASCGDVAPPSATAPTKSPTLALAAEPSHVMPEFLPAFDRSCAGLRPFRTRFVVILGSVGSAAVQTLRVGFTDRFGVFVAPAVVPASDVFTGSMMTAPPIRL